MNVRKARMREWMLDPRRHLTEDELRKAFQMAWPDATLAEFIIARDPLGAPPVSVDYRRPAWREGEDEA